MKKTQKADVISIQVLKEISSLSQTIRSAMAYQTLLGEMKGLRDTEEEGYFRLVYSISGEDYPEEGFDLEINPDQFLMMVDFEEGEDAFSGPDRGIERYEIHDTVTDDIHVMYRVPYRTNPLRSVEKKPKPGLT
ncbi:MAG: hypothetical protein JRH13_14290 [Deltaproteobacteria bacterium]|nr:hypothetical protein [Deltaproteobacteria bacterium]MBW2017807.1 hypothetical protein [Deltaproteobacteria bacterium]MBW2130520.1 hypothetical protein [Deltaproteobacteria bacterium]MBW2305112.1 hypothetical protein [Deltaproteobacteria bacterium]